MREANTSTLEGLAQIPARPEVPVASGLDVSVLIPVYNEEQNLGPLMAQLFPVLDSLGRSFEVIAVNDGSQDSSLRELRRAAAERPELKIIDFRRNFGQTAALMAAIDHAVGAVLVPIDADLQNDTADIRHLLDKLDEGYDVVSGWRKERQDAAIRRNFLSRLANRIISRISGVRLHDYGCTLKAYRREVIKGVRLYGEMHRFIPIYASWMGAKVTEIPVRHHPRRFGRSNSGLERVFKVILDLMVVKFLDKYLVKPIYVFGGFGILSILASFAAAIYMFYLKFFEGTSMTQTPLPVFCAMTFLVGVMSILIGLLAEIVVRTYFESQGRDTYFVRELINFPNEA